MTPSIGINGTSGVLNSLLISGSVFRKIITAIQTNIKANKVPILDISTTKSTKTKTAKIKKNTKNLSVESQKKALWYCPEQLIFERDFREGKEWSIQVKEIDESVSEGIITVNAVSLSQIISEMSLEIIDLLKIDIEGAERFVLNEKYDLSYLEKVRCIAVEIHDEYNIRENIYHLLQKKNFTLFESGELTIALNRRLLLD